MLAIKLSVKEERLLEKLALKRGKTKEQLARKALIDNIEDLACYDIAVEALKNSTGKTYTMKEVEEELGLGDYEKSRTQQQIRLSIFF